MNLMVKAEKKNDEPGNENEYFSFSPNVQFDPSLSSPQGILSKRKADLQDSPASNGSASKVRFNNPKKNVNELI